MPFIPDAIKQAAKELKSSAPAPAKKRTSRVVKTAGLKPRKVQKYDYMIVEETYKGEVYKNYIKYIDSTHVAISRKLTPGKSTSGMGVYHIGQLRDEPYYKNMSLWMVTSRKMNEIYVYKIDEDKNRKAETVPVKAKTRTVKTKQLARRKVKRTGTNSKYGMKVVDKKVSISAQTAITDVLTLEKYSSIKPLAAGLMYTKFSTEKEVEIFPGEMAYSVFEKLEKMGYLDETSSTGSYKGASRYSYQKDAITYSLATKGENFIKAVKARIETLKGKKYGYNLFN